MESNPVQPPAKPNIPPVNQQSASPLSQQQPPPEKAKSKPNFWKIGFIIAIFLLLLILTFLGYQLITAKQKSQLPQEKEASEEKTEVKKQNQNYQLIIIQDLASLFTIPRAGQLKNHLMEMGLYLPPQQLGSQVRQSQLILKQNLELMVLIWLFQVLTKKAGRLWKNMLSGKERLSKKTGRDSLLTLVARSLTLLMR